MYEEPVSSGLIFKVVGLNIQLLGTCIYILVSCALARLRSLAEANANRLYLLVGGVTVSYPYRGILQFHVTWFYCNSSTLE